MEQYRVVDTPSGPLTYLLVKKRVKNLNLRLDRRGEVVLSVPLRCSPERADAFVREKSGWILSHLQLAEEGPPLLPEPSRKECRALLEEAVDRVYPLVAGTGVSRPEVKQPILTQYCDGRQVTCPGWMTFLLLRIHIKKARFYAGLRGSCSRLCSFK